MNKHENILSSNDNKIKNVIDLNELIFRKLRIVILKPMTINHLSSCVHLFSYKTHLETIITIS